MIEIHNILDVEKHLDGIDAVIFDLDDTLYSEKDYVRSGYNAIAEVLPEIENMSEKLWGAFEMGLPAIDYVLENEGLLNKKEVALETYRFHKPIISLYPGTLDMLKRIKQKKMLGMITDGRPEGQRAKIESLGISGLFDEIIITDELGGIKYRKPNKEAYEIIHNKFDIEYANMIYVGDNITKDFIAPHKLGMNTIFFKNKNGLYICK